MLRIRLAVIAIATLALTAASAPGLATAAQPAPHAALSAQPHDDAPILPFTVGAAANNKVPVLSYPYSFEYPNHAFGSTHSIAMASDGVHAWVDKGLEADIFKNIGQDSNLYPLNVQTGQIGGGVHIACQGVSHLAISADDLYLAAYCPATRP